MNSGASFWPPTRPTLLKRMENADDHEAWRAFQDRYQQPIITIARKAGLSDDESNEVLTKSLEAVWKSLGTYDRGRSMFRTWLAGIVRHRIDEQLRLRPKHDLLPDDDPGSSAWKPPPSGMITEPEVVRLLEEADERFLDQTAWNRLKSCVPPKHWQVLHELLAHGRTGEEVAARLGLSRANVYVIRLRTEPKLRKIRAELLGAEEQGKPLK